MEFDVSGIISKATSESCDVSFSINGTKRALSFGPSVFYTFGVRCEGNMTNILEEGMAVEMCYRSSHNPSIVAVWLGEKPDSFSNIDYSDEDSLSAVYDKVGRVVAVNTKILIVESDSRQVAVSKDAAFRDGRRIDVDTTFAIGEEVTYDAIPCEDDLSGVTHRATCAWVGLPPGLVKRFRLNATDVQDKLLKVMTKHNIYGIVRVIPSEVVALVEVEFESSLFKVLLFRNSFKPACERIQDKVAVGDTLSMRLRSRYIFDGCWQLFAERVVVDKGESSDGHIVKLEASDKPDSPLKDVTSFGNASRCLEGVSNRLEENLVNVDDKLVVLYSNPPLEGVISQLEGVISQYSYDSACISYGALKIFTDRDNFYLDGCKAAAAEFMLFVAPGNNVVSFEAVPSTMRGFSHEATCAWVGEKPEFKAILSSLSSPKFDVLEGKEKVFYGVVSKLCLPELAFVDISSELTSACIHVSQCASISWYSSLENFCYESGLISNFVGLKDCVRFKLDRLEGILYAREVSVVRSLDRVYSEQKTFPKLETSRKTPDETLASIVVRARKAGLMKKCPKKSTVKNISYGRVAVRTVTKLAAGELPDVTGEKRAPAKSTAAQNADGKNQSNAGKRGTTPFPQTGFGGKVLRKM